MNANQGSRAFFGYLLVTAVVCGALVMVIEVLGSRVIGPFFGVSLFVWTSLITVTLVALAMGYAIGGHLADRKDHPDWLYGIILAAGVLTILIPILKPAVLKASLPLGLRVGSLTGAGLLFGPALFLLGCVSPYLVRIAAREMGNLGRTVGSLYAISTLGSFIGTVATGFFLIAYLGVNRIFVLTGVLLIALSAGYFATFRRKWAVAATLLLPMLLLPSERLPSKAMADGTKVSVVLSKDSYYGNLKVVEYRGQKGATRELAIDGLIQSGIDSSNGQSVYEYSYLLQYLPVSLHPQGKNCLIIGLGAGIVPRWYQAQGIATDAVDIDPYVVDIAHRFFGFDNASVHVEDARYFLARTSQRYDYLVLDVFNGDTTPGHLLSLEAMQLVKAHLTERGVLAINLIGSIGPESFATASAIKTLQSVFNQVEIHPVFDSAERNGNLIVIAYQGAPRIPDQRILSDMAVHPMAASLVRQAMQQTFAFPANTSAMVLTDDYNPLEFYDQWVKERVRNSILETTDWEILLS